MEPDTERGRGSGETPHPQIQTDLQSIVQENLYLVKRKELLSQIESKLSKEFGKKVGVAAYIANTMNPGISAVTQMNLTQISFVDDLIRGAAQDSVEAVVLIVESFGGEATFPLEVIQRAKKYSKEFYVATVNVAKSAATLLALISDKIIALETASFGPVDPQLVYSTTQGTHIVSARSIKELMDVTIPNYIKNLSPAEKAGILASQNYALYQAALDSLKLVQEVIENQLSSKMSKEQLKKIKDTLVNVPLSHSLNVSPDDLTDLGFDVLKLDASSEVGSLLLQYHRRALRNLMMEAVGGQGVLLFESKSASFQINAQLAPVVRTVQPGNPPRPASTGEGPSTPTGTPTTSSLESK